jgi:hypothetical protein
LKRRRLKMVTKRDKFSNLDEFGSIIENLDDYRSLPIRTTIGEANVESENVRGMVNITRGRITMAIGKRYPVFGHREALGYVQKELVSRDCKVHGFVDTIDDRTYSRILFDGLVVNDADSKLELGISFENPMDRKTRFKGYGYTWRQTCSNGAGIKKMLPIMEINERHTADMAVRVPPMIHDFVGQSLEQSNHMQILIDSSMKVNVTFADEEQKFATLKEHFSGITERHVKRIADQIDTLSPTRWDLFNASNYVTSHFSVSPDVRSEIDRRAEVFIDTRIPIVPVVVEVKIQPEIIVRPQFNPDGEF